MQATVFLKSASAEKIPRVLLLLGAETYLKNRVVARAAKLLLPGGEEIDSGLERIDADESGIFEILDQASTGSLLVSHRLLVVRHAGALKASKGSPEFTALEKYLAAPNPDLTLIFDADSLEKRHPLFRVKKGGFELIECDPLRGNDLRGWIAAYARDRGYSLPPSATSLVEDLLGSNLLMIRNALDKVMLYCGERKQIEYEDLEKSLNVAREHAIWEVTNAIGTRDAEAAVNALGRLLDEGKHPLQISFSLQMQFRQLLTVRELLDRKVPHDKVADIAGLGRWRDRVFRQARMFSVRELQRFFRLLFELENSIKSAGVDERYLLEYTIYRICRAGRGNPAGKRSA